MTEAERQSRAYAEVKERLFSKPRAVNIAAQAKPQTKKTYTERREEGRLIIQQERAERTAKLQQSMMSARQVREQAIRRQEALERAPLWKKQDIHFDAHVEAFRIRVNNPYRYLQRRCREMLVDFEEIIGPSRARELVAQRHALMYEVWAVFNLSLPQMGRLFGGRDHTTIIHAIKKMQSLKGWRL